MEGNPVKKPWIQIPKSVAILSLVLVSAFSVAWVVNFLSINLIVKYGGQRTKYIFRLSSYSYDHYDD